MVVDDQKLTRRTYPAFAEGYKLLECVGRGSEGSVWRALCIPIKKEVAVKIIELDDLKIEALEELRQQIQMMYSCSMHPHIVRYYTSFVSGQSLWCVMKYLSGGSCADIMQEAHSEGLDEAAIKIILKDTLKALEYFHANGRIHRDIKAGNIIISETGSVQVADFGVSGSVIEQLRTTLCGSPCWMAPEVMKRAWKASDSTGYDSAVDIWSLGITALELAKGRPPFSDCAPSRVFSIIVNQPPPALEDSTKDKRKFSNQFKDFVSLCLQKDPSKRPSASKLLKHKFFRGKKSRDYLVSTVLSKLAPVGERNRNRYDQIPPTMPVTRGHESNTGSWNFGDNEASDMMAAMNSYESAQFLSTSNSASHLGQSFGADTLSEGSFSDSSFFDEWFAAPTPNNTMKQADLMDEILENFGVMEPAQVHEFPYAPTPNNTMKQDDFNEEVLEDYGCVEPAELSKCPVAPTPNNTMKQDDFTDEVLEFAEVETAKLPKYSYAPTPNNTMKQDDFTEEVLEFAQEETEEAEECPVAPTPHNTMKQDDFTDEVLEFAEVEPAKLPKFSHAPTPNNTMKQDDFTDEVLEFAEVEIAKLPKFSHAPTPNNTMKQDDFTEDVMLELGEVEIAQEHPHYQPQLATIVHQS